ncbi:MAG: HNH endonuclease [Gemmatimonadaceae bacterium]|nr:HNH endonuclease [Gloeobacterales cyanobacterium ES-bin-141]
MRLFVGVTDFDWYSLHASRSGVEEVNFWKPSPEATFKALKPGEPFLFKLHAPRNYIVGGGFFARFVRLPLSLAWDAFGENNGARSRAEVKTRIAKYRRQPVDPHEDPKIGCILLEEPFFFKQADWIPAPADFNLNIVQGKGYELASITGMQLWQQVGEKLERMRLQDATAGPATNAAAENARHGKPSLVSPRLGQGSFRVMVTDAYSRRCAVTTEKTLPVLEAAHIRPYAQGGEHALTNGLLLRSDLHILFDRGYLTIDPSERRVVVSRRIREEFENGRHYYALHGNPIASPADPQEAPSVENLLFHAQTVFRG